MSCKGVYGPKAPLILQAALYTFEGLKQLNISTPTL